MYWEIHPLRAEAVYGHSLSIRWEGFFWEWIGQSYPLGWDFLINSLIMMSERFQLSSLCSHERKDDLKKWSNWIPLQQLFWQSCHCESRIEKWPWMWHRISVDTTQPIKRRDLVREIFLGWKVLRNVLFISTVYLQVIEWCNEDNGIVMDPFWYKLNT